MNYFSWVKVRDGLADRTGSAATATGITGVEMLTTWHLCNFGSKACIDLITGDCHDILVVAMLGVVN